MDRTSSGLATLRHGLSAAMENESDDMRACQRNRLSTLTLNPPKADPRPRAVALWCGLLGAVTACLLASCRAYAERVERVFSDPNLQTVPIERLDKALPQAFHVESSAESVYATLCHIVASDPNCHIMAYAHKDRLLSWREAAAPWEAIDQSIAITSFGAELTGETATPPEHGIALTTAWVQPLEEHGGLRDHCQLRLRRVYFSEDSFLGWGYSRGDYENELCRRLGFRFEPQLQFR